MKVLLALSLFISSASFAQNIDLLGFKKLLIQNKTVVEKVNQGMSKKLITVSKIPTEQGPCEYTETAIQSVLKIEDGKLIIFSKEIYSPAATPSCAGFEAAESSVVFYEELPNLEKDLIGLDASASEIKSLSKAGNIVTMVFPDITFKYDITKPSFKNVISIVDETNSSTISDVSDVDVYKIDLTNVFFCDSADSDECMQGDFSDILF